MTLVCGRFREHRVHIQDPHWGGPEFAGWSNTHAKDPSIRETKVLPIGWIRDLVWAQTRERHL